MRSSQNLNPTTPSFSQYRALLTLYLAPQKRRVVLAGLLLLGGIALQLVNPQVMRYYLDEAQAGASPRALLIAASVFIGFALVQQALSLVANYTSQQVSWGATNRLRCDITRHCLRLDMEFFKRFSPGELIERVDGDVTQLANFFSQFMIQVLGNGLLVAGILLLLYREDAKVGLGLTLYTLVTLFGLSGLQKLAVPRWRQARQASADLYGFLEERISATEDIRAVGAEAYAMQGLFTSMRIYLEKNRAAAVVRNLTANLTNLVYVVGYALGLAVGVYLYTTGQATIGTAYLITFYIGMLSEPLQALRGQSQDFQQAAASIQRVETLMSQPLQAGERVSAERPVGASTVDGLPVNTPLSVVFQEVSFHYQEDENVLQEVSFEVPAGSVLGILGRTGSGKTTLSRLLFRLYDPTAGSIRLDGRDLRTLPLSQLRQRVGMVTQDVQLFQASVRQNLTFFDPAIDDDQLIKALQELDLWEWVQSLPQGLDTKIQSGRQGFSAGEAQLLAFTRIFLKNPGLVLLDEASSRLDPATEKHLERAVERVLHRRTGVIIAHRLQTLQRTDLILILEGGRVVEFGPYTVLAGQPGSRFARLLRSGIEDQLV